MATETQQATIKIRRDTAANWTSNDPTPLEGEWCLETDTKKIKIGDGSTAWSSLDYYVDPKTICTAWVSFNGTGTIAIRDDYNVESLTDNGTGDTTITYSTDLADTNYSIATTTVESSNADRGSNGACLKYGVSPTTLSCRISTRLGSSSAANGAQVDSEYVFVQIFGGNA